MVGLRCRLANQDAPLLLLSYDRELLSIFLVPNLYPLRIDDIQYGFRTGYLIMALLTQRGYKSVQEGWMPTNRLKAKQQVAMNETPLSSRLRFRRVYVHTGLTEPKQISR